MKKTSANNLFAIDTNIFVYLFTRKSPFHLQTEAFFRQVINKQWSLMTSVITLTELLSFRAEKNQLAKLKEVFLLTPNLTIHIVNTEIAMEAGRIRREYRFNLPDSIQLATALITKAQFFITNDNRLKQFKQLKIISLNQLTPKS